MCLVGRSCVSSFFVCFSSSPTRNHPPKKNKNKTKTDESPPPVSFVVRGPFSFFFCDFISLCFFLLLETPLGYRCHYGLSYCSSCFCFSGRFSFTFYFGFQAEMMIDLCCTGFSRRWSFRRLLAFRWPSRLKKKKTKINLAIYRRGPSRGRFCFFVCFAVVGFVPFFFVSYFYFQVLFFSSLHRPSLRVAQVVYGHRD